MNFLIFPMPGNEAQAQSLADKLGAEIGTLEVRQFPDGEAYVRAITSPHGRRVILFATLWHPDTTFLPLMFATDVMREMGAEEVGLVAPYLSYMRQDKRFKDGEAITSTTFARLLSMAVDWLVTVDPHLHRRKDLSEIYSVPATALHAAPIIGAWLKSNVENMLLVGPDSESEQWVRAVAEVADAPFLVLEKIRRGDRDVEVSVPDAERWKDRTPVLVDDIISTARTMIETIKHLRTAGLNPPICIGVHAVFSGDAFEVLGQEDVAKIVTCNSVPHPSNEIDLIRLIAEGVMALRGNVGELS